MFNNKRPPKYHPFGTEGNLPPLDVSKYTLSEEKYSFIKLLKNHL